MKLKFKKYTEGYRIVSLALDENSKNHILSMGSSLIHLDKQRGLILLPEDIVISNDKNEIEQIQMYNNYDVLEIWENGILTRLYNDKSDDNYFFVTGKCNSNCIMCPSPEVSRKTSEDANLTYLLEIAKHIPSDAPHLTITGGEPFLMGESVFQFLKFLKEKFVGTEFLFLTNGRIFSVDKYLEEFCKTAPYNSVIAIPVHGSCQSIHDSITRADGSFKQTLKGIKNLIKKGFSVEVRLVVSKLNADDFKNIADLLIKEVPGIEYVSVIAMEMTGTARINQEMVWIPYSVAFKKIESSIRKLINHSIDVKLYNFPLCTIDKSFWTLCEKSISSEKVRYAEQCDDCRYKNACGGVFAGTLQLERDELEAIL